MDLRRRRNQGIPELWRMTRPGASGNQATAGVCNYKINRQDTICETGQEKLAHPALQAFTLSARRGYLNSVAQLMHGNNAKPHLGERALLPPMSDLRVRPGFSRLRHDTCVDEKFQNFAGRTLPLTLGNS